MGLIAMLPPARQRCSRPTSLRKAAGPLDVPRTPQGLPVVFTAGRSDADEEPAGAEPT